MRRVWIPRIALASTALVVLACAVSEGTPAIPADLVATTVAMTLQAATPLASPTDQPTTAPTLTATNVPPTATSLPAATAAGVPNGTRIDFAGGATAGVVEGQIQPGQVKNFVAGAGAGQPLILSVDSFNQDVTISVTGRQNDAVLLPASQKLASWQTMLTTSQDYLIQVHGGGSAENFTLSVHIPARISFEAGATSAQRSGSTPGGFLVSYVLRASAGQKMKLDLNAPGGNAVLAMYGYQDGQPYLRYVVEQTSFEMTLPATQDYIIQVVPRGGELATYTLDVEVK